MRRKISEGIADFEKSITFASLLAEQYWRVLPMLAREFPTKRRKEGS